MATTVNNRGEPVERTERTYIERTDTGDSTGWAVAIVLLLALVAAGIYFWVRSHNYVAPSAAPSTNINVTTPSPSSGSSNTGGTPSAPNTGGTSGGSTGGSSGGSASGSGSTSGSMNY